MQGEYFYFYHTLLHNQKDEWRFWEFSLAIVKYHKSKAQNLFILFYISQPFFHTLTHWLERNLFRRISTYTINCRLFSIFQNVAWISARFYFFVIFIDFPVFPSLLTISYYFLTHSGHFHPNLTVAIIFLLFLLQLPKIS